MYGLGLSKDMGRIQVQTLKIPFLVLSSSSLLPYSPPCLLVVTGSFLLFLMEEKLRAICALVSSCFATIMTVFIPKQWKLHANPFFQILTPSHFPSNLPAFAYFQELSKSCFINLSRGYICFL